MSVVNKPSLYAPTPAIVSLFGHPSWEVVESRLLDLGFEFWIPEGIAQHCVNDMGQPMPCPHGHLAGAPFSPEAHEHVGQPKRLRAVGMLGLFEGLRRVWLFNVAPCCGYWEGRGPLFQRILDEAEKSL